MFHQTLTADPCPTWRKENGRSESILCHVYPADTWGHVPALYLHSSQWNQISKAFSLVTLDTETVRTRGVWTFIFLSLRDKGTQSALTDC